MSPCLFDEVGSPYSAPDDFVAIAGFETQEIEDRFAELFVEACHEVPQRVWQRSDLGDVVLQTMQAVSPFSWEELDAESMKSLIVLATWMARQIIPFYLRDF